MICYNCHKQITGNEANLARICHIVVYLCPSCESMAIKNMVVGKVKQACMADSRYAKGRVAQG